MPTPLEGTHQHARSGKVYTYSASYSTDGGGDITWSAQVTQEGELRLSPGGVIPTGSPAADAIAPAAVVDAVVKAIDGIADAERGL